MFFKKDKTMNYKNANKEELENGESDNLSQSERNMDEAIARELNVDDSVSGMQHLDDEVDEEDELTRMKQELDQAKDKYLRLVAEFDNFRKRTAKEKMEHSQTAGKAESGGGKD